MKILIVDDPSCAACVVDYLEIIARKHHIVLETIVFSPKGCPAHELLPVVDVVIVDYYSEDRKRLALEGVK